VPERISGADDLDLFSAPESISEDEHSIPNLGAEMNVEELQGTPLVATLSELDMSSASEWSEDGGDNPGHTPAAEDPLS
jgi:hypothetical protein